jgi:hypothetical protein
MSTCVIRGEQNRQGTTSMTCTASMICCRNVGCWRVFSFSWVASTSKTLSEYGKRKTRSSPHHGSKPWTTKCGFVAPLSAAALLL